jgi:hypothetical protein
MKNNHYILGAIIFLGISLIVSANIIARAISNNTFLNGNLNGDLNGTFTMQSSSDTNNNTDNNMDVNNSDVINPEEAGKLLGYVDTVHFINDIKSGKLHGIPYLYLYDQYIFSKKAIEEWIYKQAVKQTIIKVTD